MEPRLNVQLVSAFECHYAVLWACGGVLRRLAASCGVLRFSGRPLGTKEGLGPGPETTLCYMGTQLTPTKKGSTAPNFRPMSAVANGRPS